ncbi:MAG TPA: Gfo/Idh/MocA family oxidoreductase, partial [Thermoanaerobaculia bacterium]|nr:Gfo/Idh/MocA family oxidoreductase [Thermoanaerobaculia bacterium]
MSPAPLRLALVGAGRIGRVHTEALSRIHEVRLIGIADIHSESAWNLADMAGCPAYSDVLELVEREKPEAAIVCTPPHRHAEIAQELLGRGVHVLCEKPLARDAEEAAAMVEAAERAGRHLVLATKYRYVPGVEIAKRLLDLGSLGEPRRAEINFSQRVSMAGHWYADPAISGGGVLADNGPHAADLLRFLFGPVCEVRATEGPRPQAVPVEQAVRLEARVGDGVEAEVQLSWNAEGGDTYLVVHGEEGTLEIGFKGCRCRPIQTSEWSPLAPGYDRAQAFRLLHQSFARTVRGEHDGADPAGDAFASVAVV